jgi:hypothetical protein
VEKKKEMKALWLSRQRFGNYLATSGSWSRAIGRGLHPNIGSNMGKPASVALTFLNPMMKGMGLSGSAHSSSWNSGIRAEAIRCCCPNPIPPPIIPIDAMAAIVAMTGVIVGNLVFFVILTKNERESRNLLFLIDYTKSNKCSLLFCKPFAIMTLYQKIFYAELECKSSLFFPLLLLPLIISHYKLKELKERCASQEIVIPKEFEKEKKRFWLLIKTLLGIRSLL